MRFVNYALVAVFLLVLFQADVQVSVKAEPWVACVLALTYPVGVFLNFLRVRRDFPFRERVTVALAWPIAAWGP